MDAGEAAGAGAHRELREELGIVTRPPAHHLINTGNATPIDADRSDRLFLAARLVADLRAETVEALRLGSDRQGCRAAHVAAAAGGRAVDSRLMSGCARCPIARLLGRRRARAAPVDARANVSSINRLGEGGNFRTWPVCTARSLFDRRPFQEAHREAMLACR